MKGLGLLKFYKLHEDVVSPDRATARSSCFDICAYLMKGETLVSHDNADSCVAEDRSIMLTSGARVLIPTGLIFDIPNFHSLRLHPRSGLSFNAGLVLANQEGIIDNDYKEELFIPILNRPSSVRVIRHGERIAQAELVADESYFIKETKDRPTHTTARSGGFGSTGLQ